MPDRYPPTQQRAALKKLAAALDCTSTALKTDDCGDPVIEGSSGHVYAVPGTLQRPGKAGFTLFIECDSARAWTFARPSGRNHRGFAQGRPEGHEGGHRQLCLTRRNRA
jgi:hypothetical protein